VNQFITRIELHGAKWPEDYIALHSYMMAARFYRTIIAEDGRQYYLPSATYRSYGDLTAQDVRRLAAEAAAKTGRQCSVLVTDENLSCWEGLEQVNPLGSLTGILAGLDHPPAAPAISPFARALLDLGR